ncbi:hypothetical protein [Paenarthrobacter sp. YJN-5]|uniref:hypothetical protein n=1 Tax=Paenarthrobacter sp. YJN-5 TaxID=2735316 RepID=UPI00187801BF|nr:hypothetical protein [Paenarthrobacter sp. YJN-5]QOT19594.1 hypothetical protein HMI59_23515 [Paenarthrobacter sp. YJN-5]
MALTALDLDCLEYQTGFLCGMVQGSWGEPEQLHVYARRYASVLALLGRTREYEYYTLIADTAAASIGRAAQKAWESRGFRRRLLSRRGGRALWTSAYTGALITEAEDRLLTLQEETAAYRAQVKQYFDIAGEAW